MSEKLQDDFDTWTNSVQHKAFTSRDRAPNNFMEITKIPKKMDGRSLTSLIVTASRVVPKSADMCVKKDGFGNMEQAALVEFRSEQDAFVATERLKSTPYGKSWHIKLMKNPKIADPEEEMINAWLN